MNDNADNAGEKVESLDSLCHQGFSRKANQGEYQGQTAPERHVHNLDNMKHWKEAHPDYQRLWRQRHPDSRNLARKSYIAAWKAAHPARQREYSRRWKLKQPIKVSRRKWLTHEESLQRMQEIPQPFSAKQFAQLTGLTHGGACNLFKALIAAGKIQFVKKLQCARFYEICSSVPLIPRRDTCVSGGDLAQGR